MGPILAPLTGPLLVSVSVMVLASFEYMNVFMHTRRGPLRLAGGGGGGGGGGEWTGAGGGRQKIPERYLCDSQAWKATCLWEEYKEGHAQSPDVPSVLLKQPKVWASRFRTRWGIRLRRVTRLWELSDATVVEKVKRFWQFCKWVLATSVGNPLWVNFDETPLWFGQYAMRSNVVHRPGETRQPIVVRGKGSLTRKRLTVGLSISSDPAFARRLPVFVVCRNPRSRKRPNSAAWRNVSVPARIALRFQKRAWMDEVLSLDYLAALVAAWADHDPPGRHPPMAVEGWVDTRAPLVLVWDSFRAHLTDAVKEFCRAANVRMVVVPAGMTALLQGLDTHVNKMFKTRCRAFWQNRLLRAENPAAVEFTHQDFLDMIAQAADRALAQEMSESGGECAGMNVGAASFLQNGLSNPVDGSRDGAISIKHPKVDPAWRAELPCTMPALENGAGEADPGYGSDWSDASGPDAEAEEGGVMRRIVAARDAELEALESDPEAPPPRGSAWVAPVTGPGDEEVDAPRVFERTKGGATMGVCRCGGDTRGCGRRRLEWQAKWSSGPAVGRGGGIVFRVRSVAVCVGVGKGAWPGCRAGLRRAGGGGGGVATLGAVLGGGRRWLGPWDECWVGRCGGVLFCARAIRSSDVGETRCADGEFGCRGGIVFFVVCVVSVSCCGGCPRCGRCS